MKICTKCKEEKNIADFDFKIKSKNIYSAHCRSCSREYVQNHYSKNRTYYLLKAKNRNQRIRKEVQKYIIGYLYTHPCIDCGEKDPIVLEFDHRKDKIGNISRMMRGFVALDKVKKEIEKCDVRCANCHRRKTSLQFGYFKNKFAPVV